MTLSPMEPNVSNNSCLGHKSIQVCRLHEKHPSVAQKNLISGYKSSERAKLCCTQIYGQGSILYPLCHSTINKGGGGPELSAHLSTTWIWEHRSTVKVGFRTPFAYLPLIAGGDRNWWLKEPPPLSHLLFPPLSTFRHVSSTQGHPGPSLSPFLTPTYHLLPSVPSHTIPLVATSPMSHCFFVLSLSSTNSSSSSSRPVTLWLPHHFPMALRLIVRYHSSRLSIHMAPPHLIILLPPTMCLSLSPIHLHLYGHPYSSSTLPLPPTYTPRSMPLPPVSSPYPMAFLIWCHNTTSSSSPRSHPHPPIGSPCSSPAKENQQKKGSHVV
jgi:hypothetical protein